MLDDDNNDDGVAPDNKNQTELKALQNGWKMNWNMREILNAWPDNILSDTLRASERAIEERKGRYSLFTDAFLPLPRKKRAKEKLLLKMSHSHKLCNVDLWGFLQKSNESK